MNLLGPIVAAVPQGKALLWLIVGAITVFGAGIGWSANRGETQSTILLIPSIQDSVRVNTRRIDVLEDSVNAGSRQRERILCLAEISAAGEIVPAFELNRRCP